MTGKRIQTSPIGSPTSQNISDCSSKDQDRFLPIANVSRIMKKSLPANAKISKEAKETVQECVSEFISFITGEASDKCQREKRKTINGDDLLWAMTTLGFENYVETLKIYLNQYRETEGDKNPMVSSPSLDEISQHNNSIASTRPVLDFNEAYYVIGGTQAIDPKTYDDDRGKMMGYGNGKRAMATNLHQGVEW